MEQEGARIQFCSRGSRKRYTKLNIQFGGPTIALAAIVATSSFSTVGQNAERWLQVTSGLLSILAAVLAALQTFFRFAERAEAHRTASVRYGSLRREIEQLLRCRKVVC